MKYWFTSDLHLGHHNIIRYCNRPFTCVEHMNDVLIKNWNKRVHEGDIVFHIGDFCFKNSAGGKAGEGLTYKAKEYEEQLNGTIIHIKGNHDKNNSLRTIVESIVIKYGPHYINCVHIPENYNDNYAINFVGHVHEKWAFKREQCLFADRPRPWTDFINVGVDVNNFEPKTFEELYSKYKRWIKAGCK